MTTGSVECGSSLVRCHCCFLLFSDAMVPFIISSSCGSFSGCCRVIGVRRDRILPHDVWRPPLLFKFTEFKSPEGVTFLRKDSQSDELQQRLPFYFELSSCVCVRCRIAQNCLPCAFHNYNHLPQVLLCLHVAKFESMLDRGETETSGDPL